MLLKKIVGIDISDTSIKIIEGRSNNNGVLALNSNYAKLKNGIIEGGEIKDNDALAKIILNLLENAQPRPIKTKDICLGIPDFQVFNYFKPKETLDKKKREEQIMKIAYQNIPIEKNNIMLSYKINQTKSNPDNPEIVINATYNDLIAKWEDFFKSIGLNLASVMSSTSAAYYGIEINGQSKPICLVDIGEKTTNFNIIHNQDVIYSNCVANAGRKLTENISNLLNAEDESTRANEQSISPLIDSTVKDICAVILSTLEICSSAKNVCVTDIYFCGGSSYTNSLIDIVNEFFSKSNLNFKCQADTQENQEKKESLQTAPLKPVPYLATSKQLDLLKLDPIFISALGLCAAYFKKNELMFSRSKIKALIKSNIEELKKKKREEELILKTNSNSWTKENRKLVYLIAILIIGVVLLPVAYWYRKNHAKNTGVESAQHAMYSVETKMSLKAEISTDDKSYKPGMIKSRIVNISINEASKYDQALQKAIDQAKQAAKKHEKIWPEAVTPPESKDNLIFPLAFDFIAYNENDVSALILKEGNERFGAKEFILSFMNIKDIEYNKKDKSYFNIDVMYLVNPGITDKKHLLATTTEKIIPENNAVTSSSTPETGNDDTTTDGNFDVNYLEQLFKNANKEKFDNYITVKNTSIGYLNTRQGPGKQYDLVKVVYPGEIYEITEEQTGWTKIKLDSQLEAWVSDAYIEKTKK